MEEGNATLVKVKHTASNSRCTETVGNEVFPGEFVVK